MGQPHQAPGLDPGMAVSKVENILDSSEDMRSVTIDIDGDVRNGDYSSATLMQAGAVQLAMPRPQTPTIKRMSNSWHSLPSPQTPSSFRQILLPPTQVEHTRKHCGSSGNMFESPKTSESTHRATASPMSPASLSNSEMSQIAGLTPSTSIESDEKLALELEGLTNPTTRRSSRLRSKTKPQAIPEATLVPSKTPTKRKKAPQPQQSDIITSSEPISSPFDVALGPRGEVPTVQSLDWQLQYPPGGSTHPSYPWPAADPRLVFHAHFVPLRNGLPDVSLVPALALPMNWRQASWCGLHPVVFDPYQQAFKITPVGPMPLTSEELHQGGLHDYVPGGRLHPEAGLLPDLLWASDGSDADIFNFEGVNWTLPFTSYSDVVTTEANPDSMLGTSPAGSREYTVSADAHVPPHYVEARDCPDMIIDMEEGWRWLSEHESESFTSFVATSGKTWRGTGSRRTGRKFKAPIPSLMANALAEMEGGNEEYYLVNQDKREFDAFKSIATPVHVNIALLQDVEITLVELLFYFPHHYYWRKGGDRLVGSGMNATQIMNFINMSRRLSGTSTCSRGSIDDNAFCRKLDDGTKVKVTRAENMTTSYTAEDWTYSVWQTTDYPLLALAHGLVELPSGPDVGPLTLLIQWCREHQRFKTLLSQVPSLLKEANIDTLIEPGNSANPDQEVLARHAEALRKDRLRVLREARVLKEQEELEVAREKSKRRKLE